MNQASSYRLGRNLYCWLDLVVLLTTVGLDRPKVHRLYLDHSLLHSAAISQRLARDQNSRHVLIERNLRQRDPVEEQNCRRNRPQQLYVKQVGHILRLVLEERCFPERVPEEELLLLWEAQTSLQPLQLLWQLDVLAMSVCCLQG